jgi:hypothetical protein
LYTFEEIEKWLNDYGFDMYCKVGNVSYLFIHKYNGVNVALCEDLTTFELRKKVGLFVISSGRMSPLISSEHKQFQKAYSKMLSIIDALDSAGVIEEPRYSIDRDTLKWIP